MGLRRPMACAGQPNSCTHVDPAHAWTLHTRRPCTHVDPAHTWTLHTRGPCTCVDPTHTWALHMRTELTLLPIPCSPKWVP